MARRSRRSRLADRDRGRARRQTFSPALGAASGGEPRLTRRRRRFAADRASTHRRLTPLHPSDQRKCRAKALFQRGFIRAINALQIPTVEDQPKTKHRYRKRVFAHLYAGKSSAFFYMKWQDSYRLMARAIRDLHSKGFIYVANFDLAAFYDSIDHHVLTYFLRDVGLDEDAIKLLMQCLRQWTSSTWSTGAEAIYHEHGIPQGPLSSGMLSEVVLQHIDKAGERGSHTRYIRYVDDIKIFAKSEDVLRRKLIALDLSSKEIGLFPQTAKINIRCIRDPDDEIKSVSRPPEPSIRPLVNQKKLTSRLLEITRRSHVDPLLSTRFKYLLGHAEPSYKLGERLLKVIRRHPEYSGPISSYLSRYKVIPSRLAAQITSYLKEPELYHSASGDILRACLDRMSPADSIVLAQFAAKRLLSPTKVQLPLQPSYKEALIAWTIRTREITFDQLETLRDNETDWWVRKCILRELTADPFGNPSYRDFLNKSIRIPECEIARCASAKLVAKSIPLIKPYGDVFESAKMILKTFKLIKSVGKPPSMINSIIAYVLKRPETNYAWLKLFGVDHKHAEQMAIFLKQSLETDIDAFITRLDSFCDKLIQEVFRRNCSGKYPNYGVALKNPTVVSLLPKATIILHDLHALRLESMTAHPRAKSGLGTRRLKHRDFYKLRPALVAAFDEFERIVAT